MPSFSNLLMQEGARVYRCHYTANGLWDDDREGGKVKVPISG